jgi:hypothetical protein
VVDEVARVVSKVAGSVGNVNCVVVVVGCGGKVSGGAVVVVCAGDGAVCAEVCDSDCSVMMGKSMPKEGLPNGSMSCRRRCCKAWKAAACLLPSSSTTL